MFEMTIGWHCATFTLLLKSQLHPFTSNSSLMFVSHYLYYSAVQHAGAAEVQRLYKDDKKDENKIKHLAVGNSVMSIENICDF